MYTSADLVLVGDAKRRLINGEQVVKFRTSSGKEVTYGQATMGDLVKMEADIKASLRGSSGRNRVRYFRTSKGL